MCSPEGANKQIYSGKASSPASGEDRAAAACGQRIAYITGRKSPNGTYAQVRNEKGELKHVITILEKNHAQHRKIIEWVAKKIDAKEYDPWTDVHGKKDSIMKEWAAKHE